MQDESSLLIRKHPIVIQPNDWYTARWSAICSGALLLAAVLLISRNIHQNVENQHTELLQSESRFKSRIGANVSDTLRPTAHLVQAPTLPHVIMITLDDVGSNDLGYESNDLFFATPTIDTLMKQGVRLSNYYGQSLCTPARTTILSGKFVHRTGFGTSNGFTPEIDPWSNFSVSVSHKLLTNYMSELSYEVHVLGKWNIGHCNAEYLPWNRGADTFLGYFTAGIEYKTHTYETPTTGTNIFDFLDGTKHDGWTTSTEVYGGLHTTKLLGERAMQIIRSHGTSAKMHIEEQPFFVWLAFQAAHDDNNADPGPAVNDQFEALGVGSNLTSLRNMTAKVLIDVDNIISELIGTLTAGSFMEKTILILNSDNGADPCGTWLVGNNSPLRGSKQSYFEGGIKVPAFIYAPGFIQGGSTYDGLMHHVDLLKTIVEGIAGGSVEDPDSDSLNHWQAILAADQGIFLETPRKFIIFNAHHDSFAVRLGDLKLLYGTSNSTWYPSGFEYGSSVEDCASGDFIGLFNLTADPNERFNLIHEEEYARIASELLIWSKEKYSREKVDLEYPFGESEEEADVVFRAAENLTSAYVLPFNCTVQ